MRIPGLAAARAVDRRIGNRGAVLLVFGAVDLIYAHGLMFPTPTARASQVYQLVAAVAPLWAWALLWAGVGLTCWVQAFQRWDRIAFTAAVALKVLFGLTCAGGQAFGMLDRGYISAGIWLGLAGMMLRISRWPEPPPGLKE